MGRTIDSRAPRARFFAAAAVIALMILVSGFAAQAVAPSVAPSTFEPGSAITLSGGGCTGDTGSHHVIASLIGSSGSTLASAETAADDGGSWGVGLTLPSQIADGDYEVAFECEVRDSGLVISSFALESATVSVKADEEPTPTPEPTATPRPRATATPEPDDSDSDNAEDADSPKVSTPTPDPDDNENLATSGTIKVDPSGGKAPLESTISGTNCIDDGGKTTEVKLQIANDGTASYTVSVDSAGAWSKTLTFGDEDIGANTVTATCQTTDGTELYDYDNKVITVGTSGTTSSDGSLTVNKNSIKTGGSVTATADGCPSDTNADPDDYRVRFKLAYTGSDTSWSETKIGSADGKGKHTATITVASSAPTGTYNMTAVCQKDVSGSWVASETYSDVKVTVTKGDATATPTPKNSPTPVPTPTPNGDRDIGFAG